MNNNDTIVAISSTVGLAARIIVRVSGADAMRMVRALADDPLMIAPSQVVNARLNLGNGLRFAAGVFAFFGPHSATGEDVVEFHIPGNALLARRLLDELIARGARQADAGEFTARAFFNGKLDLAEAEGVAATVSASSQADLDAARRLMAGALAKRVEPLIESVAETLALTEVGIDFSEEAVSFLARDDALTHIGSAIDSVRRLLDESPRMERLSHEPAIVLSGKPNAGKSTLLNALAGRERAITSHVAGTTRDALSARVKLPRGFVRVIDVAGVDTNESGGASAIDIQMRDTAMLAIENADLLIHVIDSSEPALTSRPTGILPVDSAIDRRDARETMKSTMLTSRVPDLVVHTKADLSNETSDRFVVSAQTGEAMDELRDRLDALAFGTSSCSSSALALNARHVRALSEARDALVRARDVIDAGPELIAVELREALDALGSVLGRVTPDDVLTRVFAAFCIGK